jgi:hypothetical protein
MNGICDFASLGPVMIWPLLVQRVVMYWLIPFVIRCGKVVEPRSWMAERIGKSRRNATDVHSRPRLDATCMVLFSAAGNTATV